MVKKELTKNKAEVLRMSIFEYDQEEHLRMEREESLEEGLMEGRSKEKHATFLQMAQMGMSVEVIAQVLRESVDVIKQWLSEEGMVANE